MAACLYYESKTGRRITMEYTLINGFNSSPSDAEALIRLLRPLKNKHVNLINVNPVAGREFERCSPEAVAAFRKKLEAGGITATVRRSMGGDISGSCGQLRAEHLD